MDTIRDATFVDDELRIRANRLRVTYRMRLSGAIEIFRAAPNGEWAAGVLTKDP